ncbi:MAG: hypothetical protein PVG64_03155 [Syntrophobacterales bacterium]|jgi:hypothetical protein
MGKRFLFALALIMLVWGFPDFQDYAARAQEGGQAPLIIDSYAASVIRPGASWRIYLHAKDDDGDMKQIVSMLTRTGAGSYPTDFKKIKKKDSKEFAGYLYLRTPPDNNFIGTTTMNLKIFLSDHQGNKSAPVEFSLKFALGGAQELPAKWEKYTKNSLGAILIDIGGGRRGPGTGGF